MRSSKPASLVAYDVGYESEADFNRAFRRDDGGYQVTEHAADDLTERS